MINFSELNLETIQSQYGASPHIKGIVAAFAQAIDPNADIDLFYDKIFNLDTAEGIGLDIWGVIVGIPRLMKIDLTEYFGFFGAQMPGFNQAPFYDSGNNPLGNYYKLGDNAYRKLIYYKALSNISDSTAESQNRLLSLMYADEIAQGKRLYILPVGVMKIRAVFEFYLDMTSFAMFKAYGLLNRGAGVGWEWYVVDRKKIFGFRRSGLRPFNQGVFNMYRLQQGD